MMLRDYKKRFLAYIKKDDFNHLQLEINPINYHSVFHTFATLFGVMKYEKMSMWMYILPVCCVISAVTAGVMFCITLIHYMQMYEIHLITESGTYVLITFNQLLITVSVIKGKKQYHNLLQALQDDFRYICTKGQKYREKFFENQHLSFKAYLLVTIMIFSVGSGLIVCACLAVTVFLHNQEQNVKRHLPFPIWLFDYEDDSPIYEVLFATSVFFTFCYSLIYAFTMQSNVLWTRVITCKADIITWNLQDLLIDVVPAKNEEEQEFYTAIIRQRMREIVEMHQSMFRLIKEYAAVYKKCLLFEQIIVSPVICMTAYCFVEKYEAGDIQLILLLLCISFIVMEFIPNYLGTYLLEKVQTVHAACWDIPFWNATGPAIRPYLVLIMQRSLHPLPLATHGFAEISLKTYSTTITRAYSCFNMLRQADFNLSK